MRGELERAEPIGTVWRPIAEARLPKNGGVHGKTKAAAIVSVSLRLVPVAAEVRVERERADVKKRQRSKREKQPPNGESPSLRIRAGRAFIHEIREQCPRGQRRAQARVSGN